MDKAVPKEVISYTHWKTEEKEQYVLNDRSFSLERKTNLICPFDQTPIIIAYDGVDNHYFCPNCEESYFSRTQSGIEREAKENVILNRQKLSSLEEESANLKERISHAEKIGLISRTELTSPKCTLEDCHNCQGITCEKSC